MPQTHFFCRRCHSLGEIFHFAIPILDVNSSSKARSKKIFIYLAVSKQIRLVHKIKKCSSKLLMYAISFATHNYLHQISIHPNQVSFMYVCLRVMDRMLFALLFCGSTYGILGEKQAHKFDQLHFIQTQLNVSSKVVHFLCKE